MPRKRSWSDEQLKDAVKESKNITEVIENLRKSCSGASHRLIKYYIEILKIDISHFDPWHRYKKREKTTRISSEEIFVCNSKWKIRNQKIKDRLIEDGVKKDRCEVCGIYPVWNGKKLVLQLDHIDKNRRNNEINNLRIVCPNCHTQTDNWGTKKTLL